jgi:hypothetical protein
MISVEFQGVPLQEEKYLLQTVFIIVSTEWIKGYIEMNPKFRLLALLGSLHPDYDHLLLFLSIESLHPPSFYICNSLDSMFALLLFIQLVDFREA